MPAIPPFVLGSAFGWFKFSRAPHFVTIRSWVVARKWMRVCHAKETNQIRDAVDVNTQVGSLPTGAPLLLARAVLRLLASMRARTSSGSNAGCESM